MKASVSLRGRQPGVSLLSLLSALVALVASRVAWAATAPPGGHGASMTLAPVGEDSLVVPHAQFAEQTFLEPLGMGISGQSLLMFGFVVCFLGLAFGLVVYSQLRNAPVHKAMLEVSELIYETCKTYLFTQLKFIALLEAFIAVVIVAYFGVIKHESADGRDHHPSLLGRSASRGAPRSRGSASGSTRSPTRGPPSPAFAASLSRPTPSPSRPGMSIGMMLISVELMMMLAILLFIPGDCAGKCFIGFAIGESLGASALRIAGGIFTKIADIGSDLMKIVFKIKEDDARNPGVIADCTGDNAGDSVGPPPTASRPTASPASRSSRSSSWRSRTDAIQVQLLVWIFVMRVMMIIASGLSYFVNEAVAQARYGNADKMNFEAPLTSLVWLTSIVSVALHVRRCPLRSSRLSAATTACGGSSRSSSRAARSPARSSPSSSRSSPRPSRRTSGRSSRRPARAARRSTSSRA